jgi:hypothetical protein
MQTSHLVIAALAAALSLAADAAPKSWGPFTYETIKVADNVYAFDEPKLNAIVSSNIIAVIGDKSILVSTAAITHRSRARSRPKSGNSAARR